MCFFANKRNAASQAIVTLRDRFQQTRRRWDWTTRGQIPPVLPLHGGAPDSFLWEIGIAKGWGSGRQGHNSEGEGLGSPSSATAVSWPQRAGASVWRGGAESVQALQHALQRCVGPVLPLGFAVGRGGPKAVEHLLEARHLRGVVGSDARRSPRRQGRDDAPVGKYEAVIGRPGEDGAPCHADQEADTHGTLQARW